MRYALIFLLAVLTALGLGYYWGHQPGPAAIPAISTPAPASRLELVKVTRQKVQGEVVAVGNLTTDPDRESRIGSPIAGRVSEINRSVGDRVEGGAPLAVITSPEITKLVAEHNHAELRYQQALASQAQSAQAIRLGDEARRPLEESRTEVISSRTELEVRRSSRKLSEQNLRRAQGLYKLGVVSARELEVANAEYTQARDREQQSRALSELALQHRSREQDIASNQAVIGPKLNALNTELKLAQEEVRHLDVIMRNLGLDPEAGGTGLVLRAPRPGTVVERSVTLGQAVNAEQELFRIVDTKALWLWVFLQEDDLGVIRVGSTAQLEAGSRKFPGRVSYLSPLLDPETRTLKARIVVDNPEGQLNAGQFARAMFSVKQARSVLRVPLDSVVIEGTSSVVFRAKGDGVERAVIEVGPQHEDWIEVRKGLQEGDQIAARGQAALEQQRR